MRAVEEKLGRPRSRRAAAEVELILILPLLLAVMFVIGSMLVLGPARMLNVFKPNEQALRDASVTQTPLYAGTDEMDPIADPMSIIKPELPPLPNRVHVAEVEKSVNLRLDVTQFSGVTLTNRAMYTSPPWASSNWPVPADNVAINDWMQAYADESKADVDGPLGLAPAWPP